MNRNNGEDFDLYFYISQFRKMFNRILVIYILIALCLGYLLYKLTNITEPVYYSSNESGSLKKLQPYTESQIAQLQKQLNNNKSQ